MHGRFAFSRKCMAGCVRAAPSSCYAAPFPPCFIRSSPESVLKDHLEVDPIYQSKLNLGDEWEHLE